MRVCVWTTHLGHDSHGAGQLGLPTAELPKQLRHGARLNAPPQDGVQLLGARGDAELCGYVLAQHLPPGLEPRGHELLGSLAELLILAVTQALDGQDVLGGSGEELANGVDPSTLELGQVGRVDAPREGGGEGGRKMGGRVLDTKNVTPSGHAKKKNVHGLQIIYHQELLLLLHLLSCSLLDSLHLLGEWGVEGERRVF